MRSACVIASVNDRSLALWPLGGEAHRVTDLAAHQVLLQIVDHDAQEGALALVFLRRHHGQRVVGLVERLRLALHGHRDGADHAVKVLERAVDQARRAEAVLVAQDLIVDVLVDDVDHGLADRHAFPGRQGEVGNDLDVDAEGERCAAGEFVQLAAGAHLGVADRTELVVGDRLVEGLAHELATSLFEQLLAEALLEDRHRRLARTVARQCRAVLQVRERTRDVAVHGVGRDGHLDALEGGACVGHDDLRFSGLGAHGWVLDGEGRV